MRPVVTKVRVRKIIRHEANTDKTQKFTSVKKSEIDFKTAIQLEEENYPRTKPPVRVSIRLKNESKSPRT